VRGPSSFRRAEHCIHVALALSVSVASTSATAVLRAAAAAAAGIPAHRPRAAARRRRRAASRAGDLGVRSNLRGRDRCRGARARRVHQCVLHGDRERPVLADGPRCLQHAGPVLRERAVLLGRAGRVAAQRRRRAVAARGARAGDDMAAGDRGELCAAAELWAQHGLVLHRLPLRLFPRRDRAEHVPHLVGHRPDTGGGLCRRGGTRRRRLGAVDRPTALRAGGAGARRRQQQLGRHDDAALPAAASVRVQTSLSYTRCALSAISPRSVPASISRVHAD
jgi:hypothetical protein